MGGRVLECGGRVLDCRGRVLECGGMVFDSGVIVFDCGGKVLEFGRRVLNCGGNGIGLIYLVGERRFVPRYYVFIFSCWVDLRITRLLCISQECR